jgi:hypothetical protein
MTLNPACTPFVPLFTLPSLMSLHPSTQQQQQQAAEQQRLREEESVAASPPDSLCLLCLPLLESPWPQNNLINLYLLQHHLQQHKEKQEHQQRQQQQQLAVETAAAAAAQHQMIPHHLLLQRYCSAFTPCFTFNQSLPRSHPPVASRSLASSVLQDRTSTPLPVSLSACRSWRERCSSCIATRLLPHYEQLALLSRQYLRCLCLSIVSIPCILPCIAVCCDLPFFVSTSSASTFCCSSGLRQGSTHPYIRWRQLLWR